MEEYTRKYASTAFDGYALWFRLNVSNEGQARAIGTYTDSTDKAAIEHDMKGHCKTKGYAYQGISFWKTKADDEFDAAIIEMVVNKKF